MFLKADKCQCQESDPASFDHRGHDCPTKLLGHPISLKGTYELSNFKLTNYIQFLLPLSKANKTWISNLSFNFLQDGTNATSGPWCFSNALRYIFQCLHMLTIPNHLYGCLFSSNQNLTTQFKSMVCCSQPVLAPRTHG